MKTFLLITAVVTAGLFPQLAFCTAAQNLIDAATAVKVYHAMVNNGMNPNDAFHALVPNPVGPTAHKDGDCPWSTDKRAANEEDKNLVTTAGNQAGTAAPAI